MEAPSTCISPRTSLFPSSATSAPSLFFCARQREKTRNYPCLFFFSFLFLSLFFSYLSQLSLFFKILILYWSIVNNGVIVSGGQQRDSARHIRVSILPQTLLPCRLPHNIEQSSLCYSVGPWCLSIFKYSNMYMSVPKSLTVSSPGNHNVPSLKPVNLFLFYK